MNGNDKLTETENVILYVSYEVLTEFLRMNVILMYSATETATATDTERWKSGIIEGHTDGRIGERMCECRRVC